MKNNYLSLYDKNNKFKENVTKEDIINTGKFTRNEHQMFWKPFVHDKPWEEQVKYRNALHDKFPEEKEKGYYGEFILGFPIMKEGSFSEYDKYKHLDLPEYRIDKLVNPVVYLLYDKGYKSYASCSGHGKGNRGHIKVDNKPELVNAFKKAGFHVHYTTGDIVHLETNQYKTDTEEETIWRKAYKELSKL
jgi:hypothetical protein